MSIGDELMVVVTEIDRMGRVNLSRKAAMERHMARNGDGEGSDNGQPDLARGRALRLPRGSGRSSGAARRPAALRRSEPGPATAPSLGTRCEAGRRRPASFVHRGDIRRGNGTDGNRCELAAIAAEVRGCTRCPLARGRTLAVAGEGNPLTDVLLVGEGPGAREDATGRPFVGPAGQLLDELIHSIGWERATCSSRTS